MTWSGRELLDCFEPYPGASLTADGTVRIVTTAEAPRLACGPERCIRPGNT